MSKTDKTVAQKINELEQQVAWFDSDAFTLEEAIAKFRESEKLAIEIEDDLKELKNEITIIKQKFDQAL